MCFCLNVIKIGKLSKAISQGEKINAKSCDIDLKVCKSRQTIVGLSQLYFSTNKNKIKKNLMAYVMKCHEVV